jgi:hypothetical protein
MTANQAARHQLRLTEDRIKPDVGYARPLPALNRVLYVLARERPIPSDRMTAQSIAPCGG